VKPAPFEYHRPESIEEAVALLGELGDAAKVLAGGQSLIPILALRLTAFDHLVDIGRIAGLRGIERRDGQVWIGAGTRFASVEASPGAAAGVPLLTRATRLIGHFQIRKRGTVGGSLAHADPRPSTRRSRSLWARACTSARPAVSGPSSPRTSSTGCGRRAWSRTSCWSR
jgi:aerobic carbon-monoxide dehydrogenase medium subunit